MTVTEVIYVTLRSGDHDLANDEAHQEMVHFLVKQSPAVHSLAWGKTIEDSAKVLYFVEYTSVKAIEEFSATEAGANIVRLWGEFAQEFVEGKPEVYVFPHSKTPLTLASPENPMLEVLMYKTAASVQPAQAHKDQEVLLEAIREGGYPAVSSNEDKNPHILQAVIAWPSVDVHLEYRDRECFVKARRAFDAMERDWLNMYHVELTQVV